MAHARPALMPILLAAVVLAMALTVACGDETSSPAVGNNGLEDVGGDGGSNNGGEDADVGVDADEPDGAGDADADDGGDGGGPRGLCVVCDDNSQCGGAADLCLNLPNEVTGTCATDCTGDEEGCPEGYGCALVQELPEVRQCVPTTLLCHNPCDAIRCSGGEVCHPATGACGAPLGLCELGCIVAEECGGATDECIVLPDTGEQMCARDCAETACPEDYFCATVGPADNARRQCVPSILTCTERCTGVTCDAGQVCDPLSGACAPRLGLCDQDCSNSALCGDSVDDICIALGTPDDESICATGCDTALDCPINYFCADLTDRERGVCIPFEVTCRTDRCDGVDCGVGANCDPRSGACVAVTRGLCDACADGVSESCGGPEDLCLNIGDPGGTICTVDCTAERTCAEGYSCVQLTNTARRACIPIGGDCRRCDGVDCPVGATCNPLSGECIAPPVRCTNEPCPEGSVCNTDTELCELINAPCTFDTRVEDCFGPVRKCSATRRGAEGVCALICGGDGDCTAAAPRCVDLYRVGPLCVPDGLGGPTTCGNTAPIDAAIGRPCGTNVTARCDAAAPTCLQGVEAGIEGFCSKTCTGDADCGGQGACQTVRGSAERYCLPANCLCLSGVAVPDGTTDLVAVALDLHGLNRCSLSIDPVSYGVLDPASPSAPLDSPSVAGLVAQPLSAIGAAEVLRGELRGALVGARPLRDAVISAAARQGLALAVTDPTFVAPDPAHPLTGGLHRFVEAAGGTFDAGAIVGDADAVPMELANALAQILFAAAEVIEVRRGITDALGLDAAGAEALFHAAPGLFLPPAAGQAVPDLADADVRALYETFDLAMLTQAAADLAATLDRELAALVVEPGWDAVSVRMPSPAGWIVLGGGGDTTWDPATDATLAEPVALLLDVSGNDVYRLDGQGSTQAASQPVGLLIDLGGDDTYTYAAVADPHDTAAWLASDRDGRLTPTVPVIRGNGPVSLSDRGRQGSGRLGVGFLVDLGEGSDSYASLRLSQGAGVLGVGALVDHGGDDQYVLEAFGQGAGLLGLGVLLDLGGAMADPVEVDSFRAWHAAQGFGAARGVGVLIDHAGRTSYLAEPATGPADVLYYSPQDRSLSNLNLAQGAAAGVLPADDRNPDRQALSGGVGVLYDHGGDDTYTAGTFAQGAGLHRAAGVLIDDDGDDIYRARYGAHGAGSLAAIGVLLEANGNDTYATGVDRIIGAVLGAGVDLGAGVFVDARGDDTYAPPTFSTGCGVDNGLGLFFDLDGTDAYRAVSLSSLGNAVLSPEYAVEDHPRRGLPTFGVFIDAGPQADLYERIDLEGQNPPPIRNDVTWTQRTSAAGPVELGAGIDGAGLTGYEVP